MEFKRRAVLAAVGASTVAGCLSGEDEPMAETDDSGADDGGESDDATVQVRSHSEFGDILVGPDGMTLYNFDSDTQGGSESTCYDGCAESWPPLTIEDAPAAGMDVTAELTTFERDDGTMQVAANGWPLYYFDSDEDPGDTAGQGVNDVWWVLDTAGTPMRDNGGTENNGESDDATVQVRSHSEFGDILVGPDGMTLYNFDSDTQGGSESTCYDGCAESWPPLTIEDAPAAGMDVTAELTTFERDDGTMQVAANGWPLYYFDSDEDPGDTAGQGVNDVWWVLLADGTPVRDGTEDENGDGGGGDDGPGGSY